MGNSEISTVLGLVFFLIFFIFLAGVTSLGVCSNKNVDIATLSNDTSRDFVSQTLTALMMVDLGSCNYLPIWFLVISVPVGMVLLYILARLIRGGG